jgi:hypothetical protein
MLCLGINPTDYTIWNNNSNFNQAITNSKNRISINPNFQLKKMQNGLIVEMKRMCIA